MTKLDYLLAIAAVITFVLAASVLASLYVNNKSNQSTKKADILEEKDVLTLSLRVLGLNISNAWFISMACSLSSSSWFLAKLYYPEHQPARLLFQSWFL